MRLNKHNFPVRRGGGRVQTKIVLQLRPRNFLQHQAQMAVPNTASWHFQETTSNALNEQPTNYNTLLHDEIQLTAVSATQTELNAAISTITPAGLNLKEGITGTLLDKVIEFRNKEDSRNGINLDQMGRQRKESALWALAQNKRYTAGLLVAAGRFKLGTEALDDITRMKRRAEEKESEKTNKKGMNYTATLNKAQAIRALNKQEHECTFSQTKTMVSWYKRIGDAPLPATNHLLLTYQIY